MVQKAAAGDFAGRFREIISDPLNLLIPRHPLAGTVEDGLVVLHNGHRVPVDGEGTYYANFSDVLIYNRGVHEPLEEYAFQQVLKRLPEAPTMLELGAYWAHYSMWLKQARPQADICLVEPDAERLAAGRANFARNSYDGDFLQAFVGKGQFEVDAWMSDRKCDRLTILHSDIQGYEAEMLEGAAATLQNRRIDYLFISTHSQPLHDTVRVRLEGLGYRIALSADFDNETTSFDGFLLAVHPGLPSLPFDPAPLDRQTICAAQPEQLLAWLKAHVEG